MKQGRSPSIPPTVFGAVRRWHGEGIGSIRIAKLLEGLGVYTGKSSVHRLLMNQPPYEAVPAGNRTMTQAEMLTELAEIKEELEALTSGPKKWWLTPRR
jgi:hypothetical protein